MTSSRFIVTKKTPTGERMFLSGAAKRGKKWHHSLDEAVLYRRKSGARMAQKEHGGEIKLVFLELKEGDL